MRLFYWMFLAAMLCSAPATPLSAQQKTSPVTLELTPDSLVPGGDDGDFGGPPNIDASVTVFVADDGRAVVARLYMEASEPRLNRTSIIGSRQYIIYAPEPGYKISPFTPEPKLTKRLQKNLGRDNPGLKGPITFQGTGWLREWTIVGDINGDDFGVANMIITLDSIPIHLERVSSDCRQE